MHVRQSAGKVRFRCSRLPRDQNHAASNITDDVAEINFYRITPKQILNLNITDFFNAYLAVCQLTNARQRLKPATGFLPFRKQLLSLLMGCGWDRKNDFVNVIFCAASTMLACPPTIFTPCKYRPCFAASSSIRHTTRFSE